MITTWADGFGIWHAVVPSTQDNRADARVAMRAIRAELKQRGEVSPAYRMRVAFAGNGADGRAEYVEL